MKTLRPFHKGGRRAETAELKAVPARAGGANGGAQGRDVARAVNGPSRRPEGGHSHDHLLPCWTPCLVVTWKQVMRELERAHRSGGDTPNSQWWSIVAAAIAFWSAWSSSAC